MKKCSMIIIFFSVVIFNTSCSKESTEHEIKFFFSPNYNNIPTVSAAIITEDWINVYLPNQTDALNLVASFSFPGAVSVTVNGIDQESEITVNNYESPITYKVTSFNGGIKEYIVTLILSSTFELDKKVISLMNTHNAPGFSLAVTFEENLAFKKTYGVADLQTNAPVTEDSIFRIASISKPITSIGILKLLEEEKLALTDTIFGENGLLGLEYGTPPYSDDIETITVGHLLDHTSGWTESPVLIDSYKDEIDDLVDNIPLTYAPGTTYSYSNMGYCILGRIIEKISGISYKDYIQKTILNLCDIENMSIGINPNNGILPNEVRYLDQENTSPIPNNFDLTFTDSYGGWVASPVDIMKIMVRIDKQEKKDDILLPSTINKMYLGTDSWYATGAFSGTACHVEKYNDLIMFCIVSNTRTETILLDMRNAMVSFINNINTWPETDLFDQ